MQIRGKGLGNLGHALWQALTGRAYSSTEKATTQEKAREMVDRYGSTRAVAEKLGMSQRSVERYLKGQQKPSKRNAAKFDAAHRETKVTPGRRDKFTGAGKAAGPDKGQAGSGGLAIYGTIKVSQDIRDRWINPGTRMTPAEADAVIREMIDHGPEAAANALNGVIERYVRDMTVLSIQEIDY